MKCTHPDAPSDAAEHHNEPRFLRATAESQKVLDGTPSTSEPSHARGRVTNALRACATAFPVLLAAGSFWILCQQLISERQVHYVHSSPFAACKLARFEAPVFSGD